MLSKYILFQILLCTPSFNDTSLRSNVPDAGAQPGGAFFPPEIFKALHSNFDICRNFQRIKMKFYILIIVKKFYWNFSLSCSLIIFLQDLACDRLSDRKFRKCLVFNDKYAGSVNFRDSLNCSEFFIYLFVYYFFLDRPQFALTKLYNIRLLLNRANCWNIQTDKRNLDIAVSASLNRLFFYYLLIIIFVRAKRITIINVVHFLKKALFSCIFASKPDSF